MLTLLRHRWKRFGRTRRFGATLVGKILFGLAIFFMLGHLAVISYFFPELAKQVSPTKAPVELANKLIFYCFGILLLSRFVMQRVSSLNVLPYLHLPFPARTIRRYMALDTLLTPFNLVAPIAALSIFFRVLVPEYGPAALAWLFSIFCLAIFNTFLVSYFKYQFVTNLKIVFGIGAGLAAAVAFEYFNIIHMSAFMQMFFAGILAQPWLCILPALLALFMFLLNSRYLASHFYFSENAGQRKTAQKSTEKRSQSLFLQFVLLQFRLHYRNSRLRFSLLTSPLFVAMGFFYLSSSSFITESFTFIITLFQSGGVVWTLGLFFLDSEGDYFDRLLTVKMPLHQYLLSHYKLHILLIFSSYILALPFGFFREHVWLYLTVGVFWNSGWLSFVIFILAPFFSKYLDIRGKSSFNMQGMGVRYWVIFLPALVAVNFLGRIEIEVIPVWLLITMAGSGILMTLVSSLWISGIAKIFSHRKYKIAVVYRER